LIINKIWTPQRASRPTGPTPLQDAVLYLHKQRPHTGYVMMTRH